MDYLGGIISEIKQSSGIYCFENRINNKKYIGQSSRLAFRIREHLRVSYNEHNKAYNFPIHKAIRKYGIENFNIFILEYCSVDQLNEKEVYYINKYNTTNITLGYNILLGGNMSPMLNLEIRDKAITKMQQTMKERYGVITPTQVPEFAQKAVETKRRLYYNNPNNIMKEKTRQTVQAKYGVDNVLQSPEVREKITNTCLQRYGATTFLHSQEGQAKVKETCKQKYGVEYYFQSQDSINKNRQKGLESGRFKPYKNTDTGFIFASWEAAEWLQRKDFQRHIARSLKQQNKRFGNIPEDDRIDPKLWGQPAHWEIVSYEEYLARPNQ